MKHMLRIFGTRSVWRHRDYRLALPAWLLSATGDNAAVVALLLRVHDAGRGTWGVCLLLTAAALPTAVLSPIAGPIADRHDSRLILVSASVAQACCCVPLALVTAPDAWYGLVVALQVGQAMASPTWSGLLPRLVNRDEVGSAVGTGQALAPLAAVMGAAVGGAVSAAAGAGVVLLLDAATFAVLAIAFTQVHTRRHLRAEGPVTGVVPSGGGVRYLWSDRLLRPLVLGLLTLGVVVEVVNVVEVFLIRDTLHGSDTAYGLATALFATGTCVGAMMPRRAASTRRLIGHVAVGGCAIAVCLSAVGLSAWLLATVVLLAAGGVGFGEFSSATSILLVSRTPDRLRAQVLGLVNGLARGAGIVALLVGGALSAVLSPPAVFTLSGTAAIAAAAVLGLVLVTRRDLSEWEVGGERRPRETPP